MESALQVSSLFCHSTVCLDPNLCLVFSAPKYCDMTENRGAYINIGSDLKLQFKQFDAVPHPNIRPMVRYSPKCLSDRCP